VSGLTSGATPGAVGRQSACAIVSGGVQCWGNNAVGQLGNGPDAPRQSLVPLPVVGLTTAVTALAVGDVFACAVTVNGAVLCWGDNTYGQLGTDSDPTMTPFSKEPVQVKGLTANVRSISARASSVCAVRADGSVQCWGETLNAVGATDNGFLQSGTPVEITGLTSGVVAVSVGTSSSCALLADGGIECWGGNVFGQLGNGTMGANSSAPTRVHGF